jgi:small-conductance mechanosensitive channel
MFATQRKSSLLAPAAVMLTLLYFRRKELLSLAPLGLVIVVLVTAMSPGAIRGVVGQFLRSDNTHVATVSDRTADYDAIRPDLWSHLAFGRGYGSYDHNTYRILDSEILLVGIETGILGLAAFLMIGISVILAARKTVALRDPRWSPAALWGVAAGVCLLVVSTLYDLIGFPHGTCIFLYTAGLVGVVVGRAAEGDPPAPASPYGHHALRAHRVPRRNPAGSPRGDRALV